MTKAKQLKHEGDLETRHVQKSMKYLEGMLFFCLTGNYNEARGETTAAYTLYKQTLTYMEYIAKLVENLEHKISVLR